MTRIAAALVALLGLAGCGPGGPERWTPRLRLVDPALREGAESEPAGLLTRETAAFPAPPPSTAELPTATIADDTRPVLAAHAVAVAHRRPGPRPASGPLSLDLALGRGFEPGARIWIEPLLWSEGRWLELPGAAGRLRAGATPVSVPLDALAPGAPVRVAIRVHRIPETARTRYRSPEIEIPPGSRLDFAIGVLDAARTQGPVRFTVAACRGEACAPLFDETVDPAAEDARGWLDRSVSLDGASGRRALRFETEYRGGADGFSLPAWADPRVMVAAPPPPGAPNLILLSIDTLRADHLGLYGYARATSPFLDEVFAPSGAVFDAYVSSATSTDPSHMTMFTSLSPLVHGVTRGLDPLQVPVTTLAEVLRAHGLTTAAFTEDGPLAHERGFGLGFDRYVENKSPLYLSPRGQVEAVFAQARAFLERHGDERFFLFLHTFQVHPPHDPPPAYRRLFARDGARSGTGADGARRVDELVDDYDREIRYVDDQLRALFAALAERGFDRDTLWVVTADHGEQFFEHGAGGHACPPYQEVAHVPLILHGPGIPAGRRIAEPVGQIDLMPTLLELMGVAAPPGLAGVSFAGAAAGAPGAAIRPRPLFTSGWNGTGTPGAPFLAVRRGDHKLIRFPAPAGDRERYFDLAADPGEERDRAEDRRDEVRDLETLLRGHVREAREARARLRAGAPEAPARSAPFDPQREQQLRSLGYVE